MNGLAMNGKGLARYWIMASAAVCAALSPAASKAQVQTRPAPVTVAPAQRPLPLPVQRQPQLQPPVAVAPGQPAETRPPAPPVIWDLGSAQALLQNILALGDEGLNPADYDPEGLDRAMRSGDPIAMSAAATDRFNRVSTDIALGHVRKAARPAWFVVDKDLDPERQDALLRSAIAAHDIGGALRSLLPTHPQYGALKVALAATPPTDVARRQRIRLNMDRWRWLPRDLGQKYIIVNVPGFHATLVENGVNRWKQRAIAGATKTPTPQLSALATGVMLNPWWEVPPSITGEVAGKNGFVALKGPDGKIQRWRQPPGPTNALGQLKFVMYNPHNIYLHDTNARSRFSSRMRALSHGCIRTEHVLDLATELLGDDGGEWTPDRIQRTLASKKTVQANFVKPVPVYIVYFTAAALLDGKIVDYQDLYGRDGKPMAALDMRDGGAGLAKPKAAAQVAAK